MNNQSQTQVSDFVSALDDGEIIMDIKSNNKANPLKTNKQRNISNSHRKSKLNSATGGQQKRSGENDNNNSTDDDQISPQPPPDYSPLIGVLNAGMLPDVVDEEGSCNCDNTTTTNNEEQSGFVDSDNENITERLCCLSKLSLHGGSTPSGTAERGVGYGGTSLAVSISKRNASYPSLIAESDSFNEIQSKHSVQTVSSSCCPAGGATTGDCASGGPGATNSGRRFRRRRRRRGHSKNSKRMAVDASPADANNCDDETMNVEETRTPYSIRPAECCSSGGGASSKKYFKKLDKSKLPDPLDSFGMKRKRTVTMGSIVLQTAGFGGGVESSGIEMGEHNSLSSSTADVEIDDQEMKSDDEDDDYSTSGSADEEEDDEDDRGREADDEQSDWVFDEWSSNSKKSAADDSALSRKKRLIKMLRNYTSMISGGVAGVSDQSQLQSREIRAGKRRVFISKPVFPSTGIWTSANEEVSKFLQDPLQSQIRLQPISVEERVQLSQLASLYSLRMDYCSSKEEQVEEMSKPDDENPETELKMCPILTKTSNTTQMDKNSNDPTTSAVSPFNGEGSSSSNLSSVYCPTYSDIDSKTSESKRIKK